MKAFIDVDIGDRQAFENDMAAYNRAASFFSSVCSQYGWCDGIEGLSEDDCQILLQAYDSNPTWASQGPALVRKPSDILAGRLVIELFQDQVPKTVENFRCLLTGEKGLGKTSRKPLHYKGCRFHRIVSNFVCQGGDVVRGDGSGGDSIYGGKFNDEKAGLKLKHDVMGIVGMANSGKNSNTSQFYITLGPAPQCDGKQVVFGRVIEGLHIVERINREAACEDGTPRVTVSIRDCGVLP